MPQTVDPAIESIIFAALRKGDMKRAVRLLLESYQDDVHSYCIRLVGKVYATRVYQRVLSAAIGDLDSVSARISLRAWLFRLARAAVIHFHRGDLRAHPGALEADYVPVGGTEEMAEEAFSALEPASQEVLQLALWDGLLLSEVSTVTDLPVSEVRRHAAAGLFHLAYFRSMPS